MRRKLPVGAELQEGRGVHFRVWAPASSSVEVELETAGASSRHPLHAEENGYFSGLIEHAAAGARYRFKLEAGSFPDPASRFQPDGPHGSSQVIDPSAFHWTDTTWKGLSTRDLVIYEMHIGTFTPEGTWRAAAEQLPELRRVGITMLELMPVAEFPGRFGWGYDGVDLFAPTRLYGRPDDFREFVDRAHRLEMMVILDVVYNHFGPDGNYLPHFAKDYFSSKYKCEWGEALNFDDKNAFGMREFVISNARYWIDEFHLDGLRIDATQQIFDQSPNHIISEIVSAAREAAAGRKIFIVGENEPQNSKLLRPADEGGCGLDALWNDDFHHSAVVAATGRREAYYLDYRGAPQEFISALKYGYLFQGQWYRWQKKRRGTPSLDLNARNFVVFLENHDQVANSLRGQRLYQLTSAGVLGALTAVTLLSPCIPMLFQGQEFGGTNFFYFADHKPELNRLVRKGRGEFLSQFRSIASRESQPLLSEPGDESTFSRCKLDFSGREKNAAIYKLHEDLLRLRREDPVVRDPEAIDGAVLSAEAFVIRYFSLLGDDRLLVVNLGPQLYWNPAPEPLLAPLEGKGWRVLWSSEAPEYGGNGTPPLETRANWIVPARCAVLLQPDEKNELPEAKLSQDD